MNLIEIIKQNMVNDQCILTNEDLSQQLDKSVSTVKRELKKLELAQQIIVTGSGKSRTIELVQTGSLPKEEIELAQTGSPTYDLSTIPEKYHECFTDTDWDNGSKSSTPHKERTRKMKLFLEYIHNQPSSNLTLSNEFNTLVEEAF